MIREGKVCNFIDIFAVVFFGIFWISIAIYILMESKAQSADEIQGEQ